MRADRHAGRRGAHPDRARRRRSSSTKRAPTFIARGRGRPTRCSACATIPRARTRNSSASSTRAIPGLSPRLGFDPADDIAAPYIATGARPRVAILREQGVNGQVEMAAAFDRAGFAAFDVHMSDIIAGRATLDAYSGIVAGGGFSYGDVLGAGEGWAKSILFNARARDQFEAFFARGDSFALGVCNGCQMMSNLRELIPGASSWPHFVRNRSEQFEARLVMLEVQRSPSFFFAGMDGSRIPVVAGARRGLRRIRERRAARRGTGADDAPLRRQSRRGDRALSLQPQRLAARHRGPDDAGRPLLDPDAASRARVPDRADVLAPGGVEGRFAVDAHVSQRPGMGRLIGHAAGRSCMRIKVFAINGVTPVVDPTAFVHPSAVLIGDVIVGARCYVGPVASLRGDFGRIEVRAGANIQDSLRDARLSRNRYGGRGGGPHRPRGDSSRLRRAPQRARGHERGHQRQRGDRRVGDRRRDGVRQGGNGRAAAHAGRGRAGQNRPRS